MSAPVPGEYGTIIRTACFGHAAAAARRADGGRTGGGFDLGQHILCYAADRQVQKLGQGLKGGCGGLVLGRGNQTRRLRSARPVQSIQQGVDRRGLTEPETGDDHRTTLHCTTG
jgi:hypothetical protein